MEYLAKINDDMQILQKRIEDYTKLRKEYLNFVSALPYEDKIENEVKSKIIWICWFQGIESAPEIVQCCYRQIQKLYPCYKKILITKSNLTKYINVDPLVQRKWEAGVIPDHTYANLVRIQLLNSYGGLWVDATVLCTAERLPKYITEYPLFVYSNWKWISGDIRPISNWFISACKQHPILLAMQDCMIRYWHDKNELETYFMFHMFYQMVSEKYTKLSGAIPRISNVPPHMLQFELGNMYDTRRWMELMDMAPMHKLTHKLSDDIRLDTLNNYNHILTSF